MNIEELKNESNATRATYVDPNVASMYNNGATIGDTNYSKFNPAENGFEAKEEELPDQLAGLDKLDADLDAAIARKRAEIEEFNDLIDQTEGNLTEKDILESGSELLSSKLLYDTENNNVPVNKQANSTNDNIVESDEDYLDEDYLEDEDVSMGIEYAGVEETTVEPVSAHAEPLPVLEPSTELPTQSELTFIPDDEEDDLEDDELEDEVDEEEQEQINDLKEAIKGKLKPVTDVLDLSTFSINKKPIAFNSTLNSPTAPKAKVADWVLMASEKPISMKSFTGSELALLSDGSSRNRLKTVRDQYNMIYNHIVSDKPATLEQWAKTISFLDIENLWFSVYRACFEGANFIPYTCNSCKKIFLSENTPIMDMVKFGNAGSREKFNKIMNMESDPKTNLIHTDIVQISDNYAFSFKEPSIFNMIFEPASLDPEFTDRYANLISIITYIDEIYYINRETKQLQPITHKVFPDNLSKTTKAKIITFSKVIKTLNSDQYNAIIGCIKEINDHAEDDISYVVPAVTCPKCGSTIDEQPYRASELVFIRHQLATFAAL